MSFSAHALVRHPSLFWRGVAALATGLLLFLIVASVCPPLHEQCCHHHDQTTAAGALCVVFAFAEGLTASAATAIFIAPLIILVGIIRLGSALARLASAEWRIPPACGPPLAA